MRDFFKTTLICLNKLNWWLRKKCCSAYGFHTFFLYLTKRGAMSMLDNAELKTEMRPFIIHRRRTTGDGWSLNSFRFSFLNTKKSSILIKRVKGNVAKSQLSLSTWRNVMNWMVPDWSTYHERFAVIAIKASDETHQFSNYCWCCYYCCSVQLERWCWVYCWTSETMVWKVMASQLQEKVDENETTVAKSYSHLQPVAAVLVDDAAGTGGWRKHQTASALLHFGVTSRREGLGVLASSQWEL